MLKYQSQENTQELWSMATFLNHLLQLLLSLTYDLSLLALSNMFLMKKTRFWSIKVKKTAKSLFSMLGTVPDGVKGHNLTASDVSTINFTESS
jgi:hypothetical protein